jgi:hypothetical protein
LYIVNIAVRLLVLAFVLVGGAITFAGPDSTRLKSAPTRTNTPGDILSSSVDKDAAGERSEQSSPLPDLG